MLHCSMHSYRAADTDEWRKLVGVSSFNHGAKSPITVKKLAADHPVIAPVPDDWVTVEGELYNTVASGHPDAKVWDSATALAEGTIPTTNGAQVCVWVNEYKGCKTFATTIGHHNETMADPVYLDLVTRGLLWSGGKLGE
jgi:type 1 glutamine amidotransferase